MLSNRDLDFLAATGVHCTLDSFSAVSYTHLRAHETVLDLVCRLLLEKKKKRTTDTGMSALLDDTPDMQKKSAAT